MDSKLALLAASGSATALVTVAPSTATANPHDTGCPEGSPRLEVAALLEWGYRVPAMVDAEGNQDGYMCGHPKPIKQCEREVVGPSPVPVFYGFFDNDLPRGQNK